MKEPRFTTTTLQAVLAGQERSLRWLTGKVNAADVTVSNSLMWYIATGQRTCSKAIADAICDVVKIPLFLLFKSTDVDSTSRTEEHAA